MSDLYADLARVGVSGVLNHVLEYTPGQYWALKHSKD